MVNRRIKNLCKTLLLTTVCIVFFLLFERIRGQIALRWYKEEISNRGEKLVADELLPKRLLAAENGSPKIWQAISNLQAGQTLTLHPPPIAEGLSLGKALVGFREPDWTDNVVCSYPYTTTTITCRWDDVESELKACRETIERVSDILKRFSFDNGLDYSKGANMRVPHWEQTSQLSKILAASVQLSLRNGRHVDACQTLSVILDLPRLLENDGVSEWKRRQVVSIGYGITWEGLQAGIWSENDLSQIQRAWENLSFMTNMVLELRVNRVSHDNDWDTHFRTDKYTVYGYSQNIFLASFKQIMHWAWRFSWSYQDQKRFWKAMQSMIELSEQAVQTKSFCAVAPTLEEFDLKLWGLKKGGDGNIEKQFSPYYDIRHYPSTFMVASFIPELKQTMDTETKRSIAITAIALERHKLKNGRLPNTLQDLIPDFVSAIPIDFMDGNPIKYRLNGETNYLVYSVGPDGQDDGGNPSPNYNQDGSVLVDSIWPMPEDKIQKSPTKSF